MVQPAGGICGAVVSYYEPNPTTASGAPLVGFAGCDGPPICNPPDFSELFESQQVICFYPNGPRCTFTVNVVAELNFCERDPLPEPAGGLGFLEAGGSVVAIGGERSTGATAEIAVIVDQNQQPVHELQPPLPTPSFNFALAACPDRAAVIGGSGGAEDVLEFEDVDGDLADGLGSVRLIGRLFRRSVSGAAVCIPEAYVAMGGQGSDGSALRFVTLLPVGDDDPPPPDDNDRPGATHGSRAILDPIPLDDMPVATHGNEAIFDDGPAGPRILVFGGFNDASGILDTVQQYDLETGQWSLLPEHAHASLRSSGGNGAR